MNELFGWVDVEVFNLGLSVCEILDLDNGDNNFQEDSIDSFTGSELQVSWTSPICSRALDG